MNLQEFINYRTTCPICDTNLTTCFHSAKRQTLRFEENRMVFIFNMNEMKKMSTDHRAGFSFSLTNNTWRAEFYDKDMFRIDRQTTNYLMIRFKELDKNISPYKFYRACGRTACSRYNYSSNQFNLKYSGAITSIDDGMPELKINTEYIGMSERIGDTNMFKICKLLNDYRSDCSNIVYGKNSYEHLTRADWGTLSPPMDSLDFMQVPLIKFSNKEETMDRISKLMLFS